MKSPVNFLKRIYRPDILGFCFTEGGEETLLSTCFGVQLAFLLKSENLFQPELLGQRIVGEQQSGGVFVCSKWNKNQELTGKQSGEYLLWQTTYFSLIALDMLGLPAKYQLDFIDQFVEEDFSITWLAERDWDDFWYASNEIMFLLFFLIYRAGRQGIDTEKCMQAVHVLLDQLDRKQDPVTGFWGNNCQINLYNGLYGAAHIMLFYDFVGRKPPHESRMLATTLNLQLSNGLYGSLFGGACEDYDAVEIIIRTGSNDKESYLHESRQLIKMYRSILEAQNSNGGFSYNLSAPNWKGLLRKLIFSLQAKTTYRYSGWEKMEASLFEPDVWATYFRTLTIAMIAGFTDRPAGFDFKFYDLPGWGYHNKRRGLN